MRMKLTDGDTYAINTNLPDRDPVRGSVKDAVNWSEAHIPHNLV